MADVKLPHISRRALLGAAGATAATSSMGWAAVKKEVETLKKKGWKAYPVGCCMCGARCGMLAMHKEGEKPSRASHSHPSQSRSSSARLLRPRCFGALGMGSSDAHSQALKAQGRTRQR